MTLVRLVILVGALLALSGLSFAVAEPPEKPREPGAVSYYRQIRPLFVQHCQGCHQPAKKSGGYVMTSHADLLKAGEADQPGVVPGKPEESYLLEQVRPRPGGRRAEMPRGKDPLSEKDVELITRWIAEGAKDDTPMSDRLLVDAKHPPVYELPPVLPSLDYSPDGSLLAVAGYHEVLLHKADGSELVGRLVGLSERVQSVAFSPDGEWLAVAGGSPGRFGEVQIWDVERKKLRLSVPVTFDTLYGVSWSHDSTKVAFGCADNTLRAIDAETGKQLLYQGAHNDWVLGTVFSKDSSYLVSISRDRSMKLTDVQTQRFIDNITSITPGALKGGLLAVARNPTKNETKVKNTAAGTDNTEKWYDELLIGGADGVPRMYKMHRTTKRVIGDDANKVREYSAMPGRIYALAFNKEGNQFAAGSSLDGKGEVRVYQTTDGKLVSKLEGQYGAVYSLAFHPDGQTLASAGFDGVVRLSDPATGKLIKEFVPVPIAAPGEEKKP
jgi:WD40 repeat protein/mono/diheme cytochrome c family protein